MQYRGLNGSIRVKGNTLFVHRPTRPRLRGNRGTAGHQGGDTKPDTRYLDLVRVTGVHFEPASDQQLGYLTIGADHRPVGPLTAEDAPHHPDTVTFAARHSASFASLAAWLEHVAEVNAASRARVGLPDIAGGPDGETAGHMPDGRPSTSLEDAARTTSATPHVAAEDVRPVDLQSARAADNDDQAARTDATGRAPAEPGEPVVWLRWKPPAAWLGPESEFPPGFVPDVDWLPEPEWWDQTTDDPRWRVVGPAGQRARFHGEPPQRPSFRELGASEEDIRRWEVNSDINRLHMLNSLEGALHTSRRERLDMANPTDPFLAHFGINVPHDHPVRREYLRAWRAMHEMLTEARDILARAIAEDTPVPERYIALTSQFNQLLRVKSEASGAYSAVATDMWSDEINRLSPSERAAYLGPFDPARRLAPPLAEAGATDWAEAERLAASALVQFGFTDARLTSAGSDGGVDVTSRRIAAQVKYTGKPVGRPALQQLQGAASGRRTAFFSRSGYTRNATAYAHEVGMALFTLDLPRRVTAVNRTSREMVNGSPK